jgi:hypothetical protein
MRLRDLLTEAASPTTSLLPTSSLEIFGSDSSQPQESKAVIPEQEMVQMLKSQSC